MEGIVSYLSVFCMGIILNMLWNYLHAAGSAIVLTKSAMDDMLLVLAKNMQSVYEIHQLKYYAFEMIEKDEKYINFQRNLDERDLDSLKSLVVRNFINSIPPKYNSLIEFHDWNSAMDYINTKIKQTE